MADINFDDVDRGYAQPVSDRGLERARRIVNIGGAVCSVALVLGLAFWGYRLAVRDVNGVPVMRAMAGAMRVAPADPGGNQASNQGLSVNAVAATGSSAPLADQITLAPRMAALQAGDLLAPTTVAPTDDGRGAQVNLAVTAQSSAQTGLILSETADVEDGAAPVVEVSADTVPADTLSADAEPVPLSAGVSLRPHARPTEIATGDTVVSDVTNVSASGPATEIDPATLETGTRLAQLGAFDTPDLAREKFAGLQAAFGELMVGKAMVIQEAQSGGRSFYRLRAHGFAGDDEARRFCAALQAEDADCIPVAQR